MALAPLPDVTVTPITHLPEKYFPENLVVRADGDPSEVTSAVRHAIETVDANQPVTEVRTLDEFLASAVSQQRLSMLLAALADQKAP